MKNDKKPEELNKDTPDWFKDWHGRAFWHFKYRVESKLTTHDRILWGIVITVVAGAILNLVFG